MHIQYPSVEEYQTSGYLPTTDYMTTALRPYYIIMEFWY